MKQPSLIATLLCLVVISAEPQTPQTQTWFTANAGSTTCVVKQVFQSPMSLSWTCSNSFGAVSGSYTAAASDPAAPGINAFYVGMNAMTALPTSPQSDDNLSCLVQVNGTPNTQLMLNGVTVPANSAAFSCNGFSVTGSGSISWP